MNLILIPTLIRIYAFIGLIFMHMYKRTAWPKNDCDDEYEEEGTGAYTELLHPSVCMLFGLFGPHQLNLLHKLLKWYNMKNIY